MSEMTEYDKLLYGLIFSIIGVVSGWVLTQLSQWVRSKNADKRNLKRVLYVLLETNFLISRSNFHQFKDIIFKHLEKAVPNPKNDSETVKFIGDLIETCIVTLFQEELFDKFKNAKQKYLDAIDRLSEIDPIHSYYLTSNTNAVEIIERMQPIIFQIRTANDEETKNSSVRLVMIKLKKDFFEETLQSLENDILEISKKISIFTYFKSKKALKSAKQNIETNLDNLVNRGTEIYMAELKKFSYN